MKLTDEELSTKKVRESAGKLFIYIAKEIKCSGCSGGEQPEQNTQVTQEVSRTSRMLGSYVIRND